jgi:RNA polymerase sigma factor (sigma-70 family)
MQTSAVRGSGEASARRPSDRELVSRFLAERDESAFAEIVTRYSRLVMSVALHTLRDPHAAEDAFQAAFLVLAKSARRIRNRDSLASWLHGTTYRVSRRLLRSRLRRKEQDLPSVELPSPIWADPERPDEQAALDEELARLSEGLRGPLVLHYLEGRTVPEIAAELMMSQSAVEGRLKRGKKTLRKRLLKRGVLLSSAVFGAGLTVPVEAGVAAGLVTATVTACLKTAATTSLAPIAATTIQQIALQEMAAMTRIALLKTALVCGGVAGAVGLTGAAANGTLGMAWARGVEGTAAVANGTGSQFDTVDSAIAPTSMIHTALAQAPGGAPNVVIESDDAVLTASGLQITGEGTVTASNNGNEDEFKARPAAGKSPATTELTVGEVLKIATQQAAEKDQKIRELEGLLRAYEAQNSQMRKDVDRERKPRFGESPNINSFESDLGRPKTPPAGGPVGSPVGTTGAAYGGGTEPLAPSPLGPVGFVDPAGGGLKVSGPIGSPAGGGGVGQPYAPGTAPAGAAYDEMGMGMPGGMSGMMAGAAPQSEAKQIKALQEQLDQLKAIIDAQKARTESGLDPAGMGMAGIEGAAMGMMPFGGMGIGGLQTSAAPPRPKAVDDLLKSADKTQSKALRDYLGQLERRATAGRSGKRSSASPATAEVREFRPQNANEDRIRKSLEKLIDFQFTGQTLQEVTAFLATQENFVIRLDLTELQNAGVGPDQEIVLNVNGISFRSALNLLLKDVGGTELDYTIENDVMTITTKEKADEVMQTVIYDVSALGSIDPLQVQAIIERTVEPASWEGSGGNGTIVPLDDSMVITTSRRLQDKTAEILKMLQQSKAAKQ